MVGAILPVYVRIRNRTYYQQGIIIMKQADRIGSWLLRAAAIAGMACTASAQESAGDIVRWRFGIFGGAAHNHLDAPMQRFVAIPSDPSFQSRDYSKSLGLAPYGGILGEYLPGGIFGIGLRLAYDDRSLSKDAGTTTFAPQIAYLSIEPSLRLNIYEGLHLNLGPAFSIPIRHVYDYTPATGDAGGKIDDADLENMNDLCTGAWGGIGYDIPLNGGGDSRWHLTPFIDLSWLFDQKKPDVSQNDFSRSWTTGTGRAGVQVKLGPAAADLPLASLPPGEPQLNISVRPPRTGVLRPRSLIEHMPLVNYIFFDKDSSGIPARYRRLRPESAPGFDEGRLAESVTAGSTAAEQPEERQMQVYYNMLNIFGERLANNPGTTITLIGSAPDRSMGLEMAENVKSYLVGTFGITPERIATKGQIRPPHASGTRATPKEDLPLITEENRRVEILTDDQKLLEPVQLRTGLKEPVTNNIDVELIAPVRVDTWTVTISGEGYNRTYGPFRAVLHKINATSILGDHAQGTYKAVVTANLENGGTLTREAAFTLKRTDRPDVKANRYSILFDYDDSRTVELYERFLRHTVAPLLPDSSMVYVHGHTDVAGEYDYNADLSMRRAETTSLILEDETRKLQRDVVIFDTYGFGEDRDEAPFENGSPEERHYNRTVVIDVFEGM